MCGSGKGCNGGQNLVKVESTDLVLARLTESQRGIFGSRPWSSYVELAPERFRILIDCVLLSLVNNLNVMAILFV